MQEKRIGFYIQADSDEALAKLLVEKYDEVIVMDIGGVIFSFNPEAFIRMTQGAVKELFESAK